MNDPRDMVISSDQSPGLVSDVRADLSAKFADPAWVPVIFVAGDAAAVRGETHWYIGGQYGPSQMAALLRNLADQVENHPMAKASYNRAERRRAERRGGS